MRKTLSSFFLFIFSFSGLSQQNDFQSWSSVRLSKKIYKRTSVYVKEGIRFRENSSIISKLYTDIKVSHRIKKTDLKFSMGYRISNTYRFDLTNEFINRFYVDYSSEYNYNRFIFNSRERIQIQGNKESYSPLFRHKLEASYDVRKTPFEPYFQFEYFLNFSEEFEKLRYTLGFSYPIHKKVNTNLYYRIQKELNKSKPEQIFILGTSLSYKL
tara:strand:+ start:351 stop:989 length:639 start_codon:yes stop_codon:yes gene_type:complete